MMKRILIILAVLLFAGLPVTKARADIIFEPFEDKFYNTHLEECSTTYYWSSYRLKEASPVFTSPEDPAVIGTVEKEECFSSNTSWKDKDGRTWYYLTGTLLSYSDYERNRFTTRTVKAGWIPEDACEQLYDATLFEQDHQKDFGEAVSPKISEPITATVFSYPNGPVMRTLELPASTDDGMNFSCQNSYTDEYGRKWGYVGYFCGPVNGWVYLEDLAADYDAVIKDLPEKPTEPTVSASASSEDKKDGTSEPLTTYSEEAETAQTVTDPSEETETAQTLTDYSEEAGTSEPVSPSSVKDPVPLVAASVGGAAIIAGVLLVLMKKKKG